jgi:AraC-like DNA-binding protein
LNEEALITLYAQFEYLKNCTKKQEKINCLEEYRNDTLFTYVLEFLINTHKKTGISNSKLNKDLKKYSVNFHQLLKDMRLSQAFFMLKNTNLDITSIATNLGFENDTYFYTFFKNATGTTPLQYRKAISKKINS